MSSLVVIIDKYIIQNALMQAEKPKRNRFRNLVPSTSGASQHPRGIGPYSSNSYIQPQHKSRTISRQHSI